MIFVLNIDHSNIPSLYFSVSYNRKVQESGNTELRIGNDTTTIFKTEQPSEQQQANIYLTMLTFLFYVFRKVQRIRNAKEQRRPD
jgi:hypothetical protein